jgi:excinuclease ABC subunit C
MLYEVLRRHLRRRREEGDLPHLLLVDGGKGQLGVAQAVLQDLGVTTVEPVALAKGKESEGEHLFLPGRKNPISTARLQPCIRLLQHLRDEAHRFALSRHRRARRKARLASPLEEIPGVGPARRRILLKAFGSLRGVQDASLEELERIPGIPRPLARVIYEALRGAGPSRGPG